MQPLLFAVAVQAPLGRGCSPATTRLQTSFASLSFTPSENNKRETLAFCRRVSGRLECLKFISATKDLWPCLHHFRKYHADRRARSCLRRSRSSAIRPLETRRYRRHARSLDPPLLLLPRNRALGVRTSPFLRCANRQSLDAESQSDGRGNHVVGGSDVFRRCSNAGRFLRLERERSRQQAVFDFCGVLGNRNAGQQLEEPHLRLFESAPRSPFFLNYRKHSRLFHHNHP